jgi:hypothetical protein
VVGTTFAMADVKVAVDSIGFLAAAAAEEELRLIS